MSAIFSRITQVALAALVGGFIAGYSVPRSAEAVRGTADSSPRTQFDPLPPQNESLQPASASTIEGRLTLAQALQAPTALERQRNLIDWARLLNAAEIPGAVEIVNRLPHTQKDKLLALLGSRWAESDPEGALNFSTLHKDAWVREIMSAAIVEGWMDKDVKTAFAVSLPRLQRPLALTPLARILVERDLPATQALFSQIVDGDVRRSLASSIIPCLANSRNPIAAVEFATSMKGKERGMLMQEAVQIWAASDGPAALEWISQWANAGERYYMRDGALSQWAITDPRAALEYWTSTNLVADGGGDQTTAKLLGYWAAKEPEAAFEFTRTLPEGATRDQAQENVLQQMALIAPKMAIAAASNLSTSIQPKLNQRIAYAWWHTEPQAAAEWVASWRNPAEQGETMRAVVGDWAGSDVSAAARWVTTLSDGPARDAAIIGLAPEVLVSDPQGAATWVNAIGDESRKPSGVLGWR